VSLRGEENEKNLITAEHNSVVVRIQPDNGSMFLTVTRLTLWHPLLPYGCSYKPSVVIFGIRALWHSALSTRVPGCQKLQMTT